MLRLRPGGLFMTSDRIRERKALAKFIHDAIEKGATTVEDIHKSIADCRSRSWKRASC